MAEEQPIGSILLADCGTVMTKVALIERVTGQYRFIAQGESPTTVEYPWLDVSEGIRHAMEQITEVTGRRFIDGKGNLILPEAAGRQGVDMFAATASASDPLKVVVAGLVRDLSVASAERAAAGTYALVKGILASDGGGSASEERIVHTIHQAMPDVICITGGTDGGAAGPVLELVKTITLACSLTDPAGRPQLLYAGNAQLRKHVVKAVQGQAELRVADNVRPVLTVENLSSAQTELETLYLQSKMGLLPGFETLNEWCSTPLRPTGNAFGRLIQYLWHLGDASKGVVGIDVGAANTTVAAVFGGQLFLTIHGGLGSAFGAKEWILRQGVETVTRWLPDAMDGEELLGLLINKEMHPASIPQVQGEMWAEQALAREVMRAALQLARPGWAAGAAQPYPHLMPWCDTIVAGGGALAHAPRPEQAALMILDAVEPIGITTIVLDIYGIAAALGNLAAAHPLATVEVLDNGIFTNLATVIAPVGEARPGELILKLRATYEDGSSFELEVHHGELKVLPLLNGQQAVLEMQPLRSFDVGLGGAGKSGRRQVSGGLAGLIIDARGRPLRLPRKPEKRQQQIRQWLWNVGG